MTHTHQRKGGCSLASLQVDRQGQPYYTRCDAPHRAWSGVVGSDIVGLTLAVNLGGSGAGLAVNLEGVGRGPPRHNRRNNQQNIYG